MIIFFSVFPIFHRKKYPCSISNLWATTLSKSGLNIKISIQPYLSLFSKMKKATGGAAHSFSMKDWNQWKFLTVEFKAFRQAFIAGELLHCTCQGPEHILPSLPEGLSAQSQSVARGGAGVWSQRQVCWEAPAGASSCIAQEHLLNRGSCPWSLTALCCSSITSMPCLAVWTWTWTLTHRVTRRPDLNTCLITVDLPGDLASGADLAVPPPGLSWLGDRLETPLPCQPCAPISQTRML